MLRPLVYQFQYVATHPVTYLNIDEKKLLPAGGGGMLKGGQIVWAKEPFTSLDDARSALTSVEGLGIVLLDPRWLKLAI